MSLVTCFLTWRAMVPYCTEPGGTLGTRGTRVVGRYRAGTGGRVYLGGVPWRDVPVTSLA